MINFIKRRNKNDDDKKQNIINEYNVILYYAINKNIGMP